MACCQHVQMKHKRRTSSLQPSKHRMDSVLLCSNSGLSTRGFDVPLWNQKIIRVFCREISNIYQRLSFQHDKGLNVFRHRKHSSFFFSAKRNMWQMLNISHSDYWKVKAAGKWELGQIVTVILSMNSQKHAAIDYTCFYVWHYLSCVRDHPLLDVFLILLKTELYWQQIPNIS